MKQTFHFFGSLFGNESGGETREASAQEVTVTSYSQPHVLREKMKEKKLTHGETVVANISPVRLEAGRRKMTLYFCPMENLDIVKSIEPGDGQDIPVSVTLEGLTVPPDFKSGLYTLKNVKLTSNGTMQVTATAETTWEIGEKQVSVI